MNTDFLIEENDIEFAQKICKVIDNSDIRNRAVADNLASKIAGRFFDKDNYDIDTVSGLHNIGQVLEDIDIADIYINSSYIDVRLYFSDEELSVPKAHFDHNLLPVAYMFIKVSPDLSGATVTGFIQPENIEQSNVKNDFIAVDETQLVSFYDIETLLVTKEDTFDVSETDIFAYLENNLNDKYAFYKSLIASKDGRLRLAKAIKAQYAFNFISINNDNENKEEALAENSEPEFGLPSDELVTDDLTSDDFINANDDEILDLVPAQDDMLLEETDSLSEDFNDSLDSSLDLVDEIEPTEQAELDIIDELNVDADTEELQNVESSDIGLLGELSEAPSEVYTDTENREDAFSEINLLNDISENSTELNFEIDSKDSDAQDINNSDEAFEVPSEMTLKMENEKEDKEVNNFEFSTTTSPSLNSLSNNLDDLLSQNTEENKLENIAEEIAPYQEQTNTSENLLDLLEKEDEKSAEIKNESTVIHENSNENSENNDSSTEEESNSEQIETLFNTTDGTADETQNMVYQKPKQKSSLKLLAIIGLLVVLGAVGYLGYNQFANQTPQEDDNNLIADSVQAPAQQQQEEAMPNEAVETVAPKLDDNEGTAESIPAIEQNLDASILVSNLKVDWEVPTGYAANTSARRYLVKLGKIIQLNLKTELLLLNKPPITNKIAVEIKYNDSAKKFEAVGVTISSGEQSVDNLIMQTVNKALAMNLNINSDSFKNLQGNPILIIHL